jgi:chromosome segregation ATPase
LLGARVQGFFRLSWGDAVLADFCEPADKDSQIAELTDLRHRLSDVLNQLASNNKESALQLAQKDTQIAELTDLHHRLSDLLDQLASNNKESALQLAQKDGQIATLTSLRHEQIDVLNKLAVTNEELQQRVQELMASRWRKLGRQLRLAKAASFEK